MPVMKMDLRQACQRTKQIVVEDKHWAEADTVEEATMEADSVEVGPMEVNPREMEAKEVNTDVPGQEDVNSKERDSDKIEVAHHQIVGARSAGGADFHSHIQMVHVPRQTRNASDARKLGILPKCARALTLEQHRQ